MYSCDWFCESDHLAQLTDKNKSFTLQTAYRLNVYIEIIVKSPSQILFCFIYLPGLYFAKKIYFHLYDSLPQLADLLDSHYSLFTLIYKG